MELETIDDEHKQYRFLDFPDEEQFLLPYLYPRLSSPFAKLTYKGVRHMRCFVLSYRSLFDIQRERLQSGEDEQSRQQW